MRNFVHTFDLKDVDAGCADDRARKLLEIWRSSNGFFCEDLVNSSDVLVILGDNTRTETLPTIYSAGPDALSTKVLGNSWAETPESADSTFQSHYKCLVALAYHRAAKENVPVFDLVSSNIAKSADTGFNLRYQRLILPFSSLQGAQFLICYSMEAGRTPLTRGLGTNGKPLQVPARQNARHSSPPAPAVSARSRHLPFPCYSPN